MSAAAPARAPRRTAGQTPCGSLWMELLGVETALRCSGAVWLPAYGALIAADLHLEKGSAYAARGQLLPPFDTAETLGRLEAEVAALGPRAVILLGDSFHDRQALQRLSAPDARRIAELAQGRTLVWVTGNHDADGLAAAGGALPGEVADAVTLGPLTLRHEPQGGARPGELAGHLHPCAKLVRAGRSVRRRAFLSDGERLILPAFGAYAGGLNVHDRAYADLFAQPPFVAALGERRVHALPLDVLSRD